MLIIQQHSVNFLKIITPEINNTVTSYCHCKKRNMKAEFSAHDEIKVFREDNFIAITQRGDLKAKDPWITLSGKNSTLL